MSEKLTNTELETSENRTARTDYQCGSGSHQGSDNRHGPRCHPDSLTPPSRARQSDHQGAQFASVRLGRYSPATVVALRTGGASRSKWTRKTRPWNASLRTTVVASIRIEDLIREHTHSSSTESIGSLDENGVLWPQGQRRWQGNPREIPAAMEPEWATASTVPPSGVCSGGGIRDGSSAIRATEQLTRWTL